jgi:Cation efflux family
VRALVGGEHPDPTVVGILLACGSIVFMPMLGLAKQRIADQLGSAATKGEGRQNMLCAYLAGALLIGVLGNTWFGAWWLDPLVGLLIAVVAVKEGREAWRGEGCCVSARPGLSTSPEPCQAGCCPPHATTASASDARSRRAPSSPTATAAPSAATAIATPKADR